MTMPENQTNSISLAIRTTDDALAFALVGDRNPSPGHTVEILQGTTLTVISYHAKRGWGFPEVLEFVVSFASSASSALFVNWLWEKIQNRKAKLTVQNTTLEALEKDSVNILVNRALTPKLDAGQDKS